MFVDLLKKKKEDNPNCFFDYQVDKENRLKNVFFSWTLWAEEATPCLVTCYCSTRPLRLIGIEWSLPFYKVK